MDESPPTTRPARRRSIRELPAKPALSEAAIVDAALEILKTEGLPAVTMRRVARALDTGAASLYFYVSGREGLLGAMLDRVTATIELDAPDPARWREQLHALLERIRAALTAHPGMAAMTLTDPPTTQAVLRLPENLLGILLAGGLAPQDAAWACDMCIMLVTAFASEDDVRRTRGSSDEARQANADELHATFAALPPDRFPLLTTHAAQMLTGDGGERFRFAIDVVIGGVVARAAGRA